MSGRVWRLAVCCAVAAAGTMACSNAPEEVLQTSGDVVQVTTDTASVHHLEAALSPDGTRVMFSTDWWTQDPPVGEGKTARDIVVIDVPTGSYVCGNPPHEQQSYCVTPNLESIGNARRILFHDVPNDAGALILDDQVNLLNKGQPRWSPVTPQQIAVVLQNDNRLDRIYLADLDFDPDPAVSNEPIAGVNVRMVDTPGSRQFFFYRSPAYSADGQWLAFSRFFFKQGNPQVTPPIPDQREPMAIYAYRLADGLVVQVTSGASLEDFPTWSPDGHQIAFESNRTGLQEIWVADVDPARLQAGERDLNIKRLTFSQDSPNIPAWSEDPTWSPDGSTIVFVSTRRAPATSERDRNLWRMNPDGSNVRIFFFSRSDDVNPLFSPTNPREVVFSTASNPVPSFDGQKSDIYIIRDF